MAHDQRSNLAVCECGEAAVALTGAPIQSVICYCGSCRKAARGFEQVSGSPSTVAADGGVDYCLYRKDRLKIARGADRLEEHRLTPASPTRRVVANCCGSPMFLDFTPGHWLTIYRDRLTETPPEAQMRIMVRDRPEGPPPSDAIPAYDAQPPRFLFKLLGAWAAMGFRRPTLAW